MLKLLVVEDHALVREGLVRLLGQIEAGATLYEAADFESALTLLDGDEEVDLVLLDLALPGIDGFAGLDILRRRYPAMPLAVVSAFDDVPTITRVLNLGASGFIPKAFSGEALLAAVRDVLAGNIFRPSGQSAGPTLDAETPIPPAKSGIRPDEVGLTNRDIADQLGLSEGTVKIHATAVFKTLGVSSRTQALVAVARYGIDFESVF